MNINLFLLFALFLTLKLCDVIKWSWIWVTAPIWIPYGIVFIALSMFGTSILVKGLKLKVKTNE